MLAAPGNQPDFRTIADFRKTHLTALTGLFEQVLRLARELGALRPLGRVALDGKQVKANASKHKAMSYKRMGKRADELEAEVTAWMDAAAKADAGEDAAFGRDKSGEEMPAWVGDKKRRAEKIRAAKAELEAEARAAAEAERKARTEADQKREAEGRKKPGRPAAPPSEDPDPKAQKNFTDPESRIMKAKDGFIQGYNAQAAVDAEAQVIVAHGLDANGSDQHQLTPMVDAVEANMGRKPEEVSADAGYCSDANLAAMEERAIDTYIAAGRAKHPTDGEGGSKRVADMREKLKAGGHESPYRLRKQLPEPVFGQIKQARGFRQFLMRGLGKVAHEWGLVCLAHNMLKLAQGPSLSAAHARHCLNLASPPKPAKSANSGPRPARTLHYAVAPDTIWTGSYGTAIDVGAIDPKLRAISQSLLDQRACRIRELTERLFARHFLHDAIIVPRIFRFRRLLDLDDVHGMLHEAVSANKAILSKHVADLHLVQFIHHFVGIGRPRSLDGGEIGGRRGIVGGLDKRRLAPDLVQKPLREGAALVVEVPVPSGREIFTCAVSRPSARMSVTKASRAAGFIVLVMPSSLAAFSALEKSGPALAKPST